MREWIPVVEKLPKENQIVLICTEYGELEFGKRCGNKWELLYESVFVSSIYGYWATTTAVIAWMPLPKPYEEEMNIRASVLIKGIEMPKEPWECPCHNGENGRCNVTQKVCVEIPKNCPLEEVEKKD